MKVFMSIQGSEQWFLDRRGHPSASEFKRIFMPKKRQLSTQAKGYIAQLCGEVLSPLYPMGVEHFTTRGMDHGLNYEDEARKWYAIERDCEVQQVGGCLTGDGRFWCSPDGLIGTPDNWLGGLELKCPEYEAHAESVLDGTIPDKYMTQLHGSLIVTGLPWWDYMSYHPGMEPLLIRVTPNDYTKDLAAALEDFWPKYQAALKRLKGEREPGVEPEEAA